METQVTAQQQRELEEIRARDERRRKEEEERKRRAEEERREEERKAKEEKLRRAEEERQRLKREEEWKKLGSDKIVPLPPVPPSVLDDSDPLNLKSWFLDDETSKPVLRQASLKPGKKLDGAKSSLLMLRELGIVYFRINLNDFTIVNQIVKERCYKHVDELKVSQTSKDELFLEKWFQEHFNEDEEFRLVTDGSCYYDVRSKNDTWIRMQCNAGDLIIFPAGLYHRSTLDESDFCAIMRCFRDAQRWNPIFRNEKRAENHPARLAYLRSLKKGNVAVDLGFK